MYIAQLALRHFMNNEWIYPNDNLLTLQKRITEVDKKDWDYDFTNYELKKYLRSCMFGMRRYLLNEADDTLPKAKKHYARMYWAHNILQFVLWSLFFAFVWKYFQISSFVQTAI